MDKNSEQTSSYKVSNITMRFFKKKSNLVLCTEVFDKAKFLNYLFNNTNEQIILLDTDLLMTGYFQSEMIPKRDNLIIFSSDKETWNKQLTEIINRISKNRCLIVIDSLNGAYNLFNGLDSVRFVDSCIMLLLSLAKETSSLVVTMAIIRDKEEKNLILSPGGKQVVKSEDTDLYLLNKKENKLVIVPLTQNGQTS